MAKTHLIAIGSTVISLSLAGCMATGENLASNVYQADQVNTRQQAKVVNILAVLPAKVEVDNSQARKSAQLVGGLLGAIGGGVIGNNVGRSPSNATIGVAGGAATGAVAGSLVPGKVLVDGVSITYDDHGQTFNSAQVGSLCQFAAGKPAVVIATSPTETRIQPNATCPVVATKS